MKIHKDIAPERLWLSQCNYVENVLDKFNMGNTKFVSTPLVHHFKLSITQWPKIDDEAQDVKSSICQPSGVFDVC